MSRTVPRRADCPRRPSTRQANRGGQRVALVELIGRRGARRPGPGSMLVELALVDPVGLALVGLARVR